MNPAQGTGAVNAEGKVMIFVATEDWLPFEEFMMDVDVLSLVSERGLHRRVYGKLTLDAARRTGKLMALRVDENGRAMEVVELEARRGR